MNHLILKAINTNSCKSELTEDDPNFVYLEVDEKNSQTINDYLKLLPTECFEHRIAINDNHRLDFNLQFIYQGGDGEIEQDCQNVSHTQPYLNQDGLYFNVSRTINHDVFLTDTFSLEEIASIDQLEMVPMTFTSEWDTGETITTNCKMHPLSGELEIEISQGLAPTGCLLDEYVTFNDQDYPVFSLDEFNEMFVKPHAFFALRSQIELQASGEASPTM